MDATVTHRTFRLSAILPLAPSLALQGLQGPSRKGQAERTVESILSQPDPLGTEIVVVGGPGSQHVLDHLESVFSGAVAIERLKTARTQEGVSLTSGWNRGVGASTGSFLAFVRPGDEWKRGRLSALESLLRRNDLILESRLVHPGGLDLSVNPASDRLLGLITENWAVPSSGVVRRELFDRAGGFPRATPATSEEYELWVHCLVELLRSERPGRLAVMPQEWVIAASAAGGYANLEGRLRGLLTRIESLREAGSLLRSARGLPPRYWPALARRFGGGRIMEAVDSARRRLLG